MNEGALMEKILMLEYHQKLLLKMLDNNQNHPFYRLVIEKSLREEDVRAFFQFCDELSNDLAEQKAEGFVHFYPLYEKFKSALHPNLQPEEVIKSCLSQQLYTHLMSELIKYV
jgi:hypothetical protein